MLPQSYRLWFGCAALLLVPREALPAFEPDIRRDATVAAVEKALPSVVNIATETLVEQHDWYDEIFRRFYGVPGRTQRSLSLGSGVIIDEDGYILTNYHVVRRASRIQVKMWDGREYDAETQVMATSASDVALLKIVAKPGEKFTAIRFAADDDLLLGETVLALGNPFGLGGSVTKGILSSKNRRPSSGNEPLNVEDWLQTDAAINPGNSGGPLINLKGELIGLNVAVYREQDGQRGMGVGFSIPIKQVSAALARFFSPEITHSLWFGAQVKAAANNLVITAVQDGSPAQRAGLRPGDTVIQVNGQVPTDLIHYNRLIADSSNRAPRLTVRRGVERLVLQARLVPFPELIRQKLGISLLEDGAKSAARLGLAEAQGLYIEEVEKDGPAGRSNVPQGALLANVEGREATDLRTVGEALSEKKKGDPVLLGIVVPRQRGRFVELRQATVEVRLR